MAIERELKLALPGDLPAARADALIAHLDHLPGAEARGERHLVNRYFDTPSLALAHAKAALRLRYVARDGHAAGFSPAAPHAILPPETGVAHEQDGGIDGEETRHAARKCVRSRVSHSA